MTPEEARGRVAAENEKLRALEDEVTRIASTQPTPVLFALLRSLVEMVCQAQGPHFAVTNRIKFYEATLRLLNERGIA